MRGNEEAFFNYLLDNGVTLDGEDTVELVVRIFSTDALDSGKVDSLEDLDSFIDGLFRERHRDASTEDIDKVKTNMIVARKHQLYRETSDIYRAMQICDSEKLKERYNIIRKEINMLREDPYNYFTMRFSEEKRR